MSVSAKLAHPHPLSPYTTISSIIHAHTSRIKQESSAVSRAGAHALISGVMTRRTGGPVERARGAHQPLADGLRAGPIYVHRGRRGDEAGRGANRRVLELISTPKCVVERSMSGPSDLGSFAERAEAPLEAFRARLQVRLSRLGLPCGRSSLTTLWAQTWPRQTLLLKSKTRSCP